MKNIRPEVCKDCVKWYRCARVFEAVKNICPEKKGGDNAVQQPRSQG